MQYERQYWDSIGGQHWGKRKYWASTGGSTGTVLGEGVGGGGQHWGQHWGMWIAPFFNGTPFNTAYWYPMPEWESAWTQNPKVVGSIPTEFRENPTDPDLELQPQT